MDLPSRFFLRVPATGHRVLVSAEKTDAGYKLTVAPKQKEWWTLTTTHTPFQNRTVPFVTSTGEVIEKYLQDWGSSVLSPDGVEHPVVVIKKHTDIFGKNVRLRGNVRICLESDDEDDNNSLYSDPYGECCPDEDENGNYC
jgi:hypothetical protein